ncbi:glycosyltransferase family 4 protein [Marinobacterium stanieri]|uniref:Glycosyltransferase involved in cell wall bisynthesis n=1 Tax=Marinobacterium stanieri TaxID=49186 RepID=A0A1N6T219_9GAMM|nr:glycosyltransferase family 4 protein [Marinobacterium stanieri]SIQ47428.1 Glycosyltransferase involved in cell wall bisynthesis [Marinobacterium stanieri]
MPLARPLKVVQLLPALESGGVERGTVEFARELVRLGHESIVVSNGGRQVERLEQEGSRHIQLPIHRKSLWSLTQVRPLRRLLTELNADILHVRSRAPAWITWLAWRKMDPATRPRLVSTFHGMYSVNAYSAIMAKAEQVIAISDCVEQYIRDNYQVPEDKITRIYRGLDPNTFNHNPDTDGLRDEFPQFEGKKLLLMPGRLSRWKGQLDFIEVMHRLLQKRDDCHGIILGGAEANKESYREELEQRCRTLGIEQAITFTGHRSDIQAFYNLCDLTCHLSSKAEPFGRTVPEALATGCPVIAYDRGGASESLHAAFPDGLVPADDIDAFVERIDQLLNQPPGEICLPDAFYLKAQAEATLGVYYRLLDQPVAQHN